MEPEKGDKSIHVSVETVKRAFLEVGAQAGDTVMMHGSLSSMGTVDGGPVTLFDGVLAATAPGGTVAMPSFWFFKEGMLEKDFDLENSPAYTGALSEAIRKDPRAFRSNHFSHSVAAIGGRAAELTADHGKDGLRVSPWTDRAFAWVSPWGRFYNWNALYCLIGVDMNVCTMKHWVEGTVTQHYLDCFPEEKRAVKAGELRHDCQTGIWCFFNASRMQVILEEEGLVRKTKLGSATLRAMRTRPIVDRMTEILLSDPVTWLPEQFRAWAEI